MLRTPLVNINDTCKLKPKKVDPKKTRLYFRSSVTIYYQLNGNNVLMVGFIFMHVGPGEILRNYIINFTAD